jgi:anti-anti-sigma factor
MAVLTEKIGDVVVVIPEGMLRGDKETNQVENELRRLLQGGQRKVLLDLHKTTHLSSIAIGVLAGVHTTAANRNVHFYVCNVERRIQNVLTVLRLVNVLNVFDTRDDALRALAKL